MKVPRIVGSITEGILKVWMKQVGDTVATDEEVASIETDKFDPCSTVHGTHIQ